MTNKAKSLALDYHKAGIVSIPLKKDKRPAIKWAELQKRQAPEEEIAQWPWAKSPGLALLTGAINGNMEVLDFDFKHGLTIEQYQEFEDRVEEIQPGLPGKMLRQKTPTGGRHWIYRCKKIGGNAKLALNSTGEATIETRGEGGFINTSPLEGYEWQVGEEGEGFVVTEITIKERATLFKVAATLSEIAPPKIKKAKASPKKGKFVAKEVPTFPPCFIDFSNEVDIKELVEEDGWTFLEEGVDDKNRPLHRYARPGVDHISGTLYPDDNTFYVFSTSTVFPNAQMMSPAEYIMYRDFAGVEKAMIGWLEEEGYANDEPEEKTTKKGRLKEEKKARRYNDNLVHDIKLLTGIRYNSVRQCFESKQKKQSASMDEWNGLDSKSVSGKLMARGVTVSPTKVQHVLANEENWDNTDPIQEWLDGLKWDRKPRIDELASYVRCKDQKRWKKMFKKHMVRCVRQLYLEEVNRYALILYSNDQGNGKSTFIRYIVKAGVMTHYYSEDLPKESGSEFGVARFLSMNAHGNMEELDAFKKNDIDHLKSLTTRQDVSMRKMRTDAMFTVPRRANFWGSTNKGAFLMDNSNTRWVINEVESIDWGYVDVNIIQVWAEAVALHRGGFECDLGRDEIGSNEAVADKYKSELFPREMIDEVFDIGTKETGVFMSTTEMMDDLKLYYSYSETSSKLLKDVYINTFGTVVRGAGFVNHSRKLHTKAKRGYYVIATKEFEKNREFVDSNYLKNKQSV